MPIVIEATSLSSGLLWLILCWVYLEVSLSFHRWL
jgi:hypothetical protein